MKKILLFVALFAAFFSLIGFNSAKAATPTLSLTNTGSTIFFYLSSAPSYSTVDISYVNPGSNLPTTITNTNWQTNSSGSFSTTIDANSYNILSGASVYATVGGQQSSWVTFNNSGSNSGNFYLSQSSLTLAQGQSSQVTAYNTSGSIYLSSNTNSGVASSSVSGNTITIYAGSQGSTTMSFCGNYQSSCATLYVTVSGGSSGNQLTFSNSNPSLTANQSQSVNIYSSYSGSYSYYVSNNTNSSVVDTSISGSSLYLYGKQNGNATVTVCQYTSGYCGYLYVNVGGGNTGQVWFSPSNPTLSAGQSLAVSINSQTYYNTSASQGNYYYVSSNSNSSVVSTTVSGATLNLYAQNAGTSNIQVCHSSLFLCGTLTVTVTGSSAGQNLTFSNSSPSLRVNETVYISIYSNYQPANYYQTSYYYISSNSNPTAVSASISGSQLVLTGMQNGYANIQVCQQSMSNCGSLTVTVSGYQHGGNTYQNGQLINENGTIYIVYKNTKTPFANAESFKGFGFRFEHAWSWGMNNWSLVNSGRVITTSQDSHPWGSWILDNGTVYFVHEQGLIPVPTWDIFLGNGGQQQLLVQANIRDMQRTRLSLMVYGDTRLR